MEHIRKHIKKIESFINIDVLAVGSFIILIFSFLYFTGTLNSGYHFIDDHSMISMQNDLEKNSFLETTTTYVKNDFNIRFRPLFYLYYISEVKVFGLNFFALSIFTGMLAFFSFSFFYFGMRKLKHSITESFLFVLLVFLGTQSAVWWRLGTNETIGMFFLGLSFLFMARCSNNKNYKINSILFIVFLIIASLCKESFIIIVPAFALYKVWNEKNIFNITFKESIKKNYLLILPLIIMIVELAIIKFVVGTNKIGYAGLTSSGNEFIEGLKNIFFNKSSLLLWLKFIGGLIFLYMISFLVIKGRNKTTFVQSLKSFSIYFCFACLVVLPNIFMYTKSGMVERYLLPATLGLSFFVVGLLHNTKQIFLKSVMCGITLLFLFASFQVVKVNAVNFANEGENTNALLSSIIKNSDKNSKILLVVDPVDRFEISDSARIYLEYYGLNNLYAYPMTREYGTYFERGLLAVWEEWFKDKELENIGGQPDSIIVIDKKQTDLFFRKSGLLKGDYKNVMPEDNPYSFFVKK